MGTPLNSFTITTTPAKYPSMSVSWVVAARADPSSIADMRKLEGSIREIFNMGNRSVLIRPSKDPE